MIAQTQSSSGLVRYLRNELVGQGYQIRTVDCRSRFLHKFWPAVRAFHPNREVWYKRRWEAGLYSVDAWQRNTRFNGRLIDRLMDEKGVNLQVGGLYFPHPNFRQMSYFLFQTYTFALTYRDQAKPWLPPVKDRPAVLELEKELYQHAQRIFVSADYVKRSMVDDYRVDPRNIQVVGMGVDPFFVEHSPPQIPDSFDYNLLFVGHDFGYKGGRDLLHAFRIAKKRIPELRLTLVGPGTDQVPEEPGVKVCGRVTSRQDVLEYYRSSDLFIMPSYCDSFGFVFLEAMSQGVPCIGSNLNAMPEIIEHGVTGYIVPVHNPEALAAHIMQYYERPAFRQSMGMAAFARVKERFIWRQVIDRMLAGMAEGHPNTMLSTEGSRLVHEN